MGQKLKLTPLEVRKNSKDFILKRGSIVQETVGACERPHARNISFLHVCPEMYPHPGFPNLEPVKKRFGRISHRCGLQPVRIQRTVFYTRLLKRYCTVSASRSKSSSSNLQTSFSSVKFSPQEGQLKPTDRQVNRVTSSPSGHVGQWTPVVWAIGLRGTNCVLKYAIVSITLLSKHHERFRFAGESPVSDSSLPTINRLEFPIRNVIFRKKTAKNTFLTSETMKSLTLYFLYMILNIYYLARKNNSFFSMFCRRRVFFEVKPFRGSVLNPTPNRQARISNG